MVRPHAVVDSFTATPVAPGAAVTVKLGGLWARPAGNPAGSATFRKVSGPAWLAVAADGTVTGTAPGGAAPGGAAPRTPEVLVVGVKDSAGATDTVTVLLPVVDPATAPRLKVASWNLANAGAAFTDATEKQLRVVLAQGLDVLALQETAGKAAQALADALGWYAHQSAGSVGLLSRYPLTAVTPATAELPAAGATVQLPGGRAVRVWTAHLDESDYGPYALQDGRTSAQVLAAENTSVRLRQARALAAAVTADAAAGAPVVLAGARRRARLAGHHHPPGGRTHRHLPRGEPGPGEGARHHLVAGPQAARRRQGRAAGPDRLRAVPGEAAARRGAHPGRRLAGHRRRSGRPRRQPVAVRHRRRGRHLPALKGQFAMSELSRRTFVGATAAAGAAALTGLQGTPAQAAPDRPAAAPDRLTGTIKDVKHVVVLMQENRSFDHYFGALNGVRGFGDKQGLQFPDGTDVFRQPDPRRSDGNVMLPYRMDTSKYNAQNAGGLPHDWATGHQATRPSTTAR
ncbi:endonuclease/exonuclease/phosphatase family protein [Streptomyces sp. NRRL S-495]|uniref:endonuclease/exonuclease/phosphatase family protein n=1 Tax=Streptomyces sp. NRRL S-495 TaxID=1609133 RepID=UPI0005F92458|nr:endonuclease/exonuclease/phosphatase family protein [Streptomyces sp. NRRL S-495]KJY31158.1 hypothetical protein VR45_25920 [Streptomyces sp. NRRL S-495]